MSKLFSENAYSILGLDTSASQKNITKRSKEILHQLFMDDSPEYETDISSINQSLRSEASVNDAVQRLSSPVKRIQEYFFWFEIEGGDDEKNLALLRDDQYDEALDNWKDRSEKSYTAKRNLAISSSLLASKTGYKKHLKLSLDAWKEVVESDKFWSHFEKVYALNDEIGTSSTALNEFRKKVTDYLSDFYTDVSRAKQDNSIFAAFSAAFGVKGQKVQDEVLAPIFDQINSAAEQLRGLDASADGKLSPQESMTIKRLTKKIQDLFQEIKDLGLYEDSQSKAMRDKAADALNIVGVDLFNNLDEDAKALVLIKLAKSLAIGPAVISQINKNADYIREVTSHKKVITPINDLIEKNEYDDALVLLDQAQKANKGDDTLQKYFTMRIRWCVTAVADRDFEEAQRLFKAERYEEAFEKFKEVYEFIYSYIVDFDIDVKALDNVLNTLWRKLENLDSNSVNDAESYRTQVIENSNYDEEESFERPVISLLMNSAIFQRMAEQIPEIKKQNKANGVKKVIWNLVIWGAIIGFIAIVGSNNGGSDSSSSSSNSAWQTCSDEYDALSSQLTSVESQMDSYDASGDTESYNSLVPQQNELVADVNAKSTECNGLR
ncbi:hypothetical protein A2707_02845 [Candidatus Saccharibacteria bacterium RIFCSPHIGHO2_01_FULL_45_15]|nr:MAG: hypothetical protein A2707_02845 [Candidatus Saccharibacteria bacterium RIFCSPHIGHO2_01_FULL_45_15]OGL27052.1 MAG: hypothetical protein A3C39_00695 [Candidatus Saccharibacteria bacterium RIFCSPHIGHO2_02_FULL_46_12]OGL31863.1 MAG: hypothetical protein A3E76_03440 [Candidatus Saccharibacteria bacterium RIFCSPHIGHO2_12_FULL_44_22]